MKASGLARGQHHAHVAVDDASRGRLDGRHVLHDLDDFLKKLATVLGSSQIATAEHDRDLDLVTRTEKPTGVIQLGFQIVIVDVGPQLDLLDHDSRLFLASLARLLVGLKTVFTPVHDSDHDGACIRSDLDQIEAGVLGGLARFFDGDDADLFAVGTD